jgi:site-specific recombinase XerD
LKIVDPEKALYSFRYSFRDAISAVGADDHEKDMLMGHAEVGTGRKYGEKNRKRRLAWSISLEWIN